jgi:hypothetical protein
VKTIDLKGKLIPIAKYVACGAVLCFVFAVSKVLLKPLPKPPVPPIM